MESPKESNPYEPPQFLEPAKDEKASNRQRGEKLIVLATFNSSTDAHLLRNVLEENGVDARVGNETTTAIFGATIAGPSSAFWIEVLVLKSDAEKALEIKNRFLANTDGSPIPEWTCKCGETVDAGFAVCWSCESQYSETDE